MAFPAEITARSPLLLIGCGHMGGALLKGWLAQGLPKRNIVIADPRGKKAIERAHKVRGLRVFATLGEALKRVPAPRAAVVAVKPQAMAKVFQEAKSLPGGKTLVLSIAAGVPLRAFAKAFGKKVRAIRAMPNTPAAVGKGVAVVVANGCATIADRKLASALLGASGKVFWSGDERWLDAVTAVSGSGPAYFYAMVEALAEAGGNAGLPKAMAETLALETFLGSAALLAASGEKPETLRRRVTSKGGTTEAALKILLGKNGLKPLMTKAVAKATARGRALAR